MLHFWYLNLFMTFCYIHDPLMYRFIEEIKSTFSGKISEAFYKNSNWSHLYFTSCILVNKSPVVNVNIKDIMNPPLVINILILIHANHWDNTLSKPRNLNLWRNSFGWQKRIHICFNTSSLSLNIVCWFHVLMMISQHYC